MSEERKANSRDQIRLESLIEIEECASSRDARTQLLSHCINHEVPVYFAVPPGHVVAVFGDAVVGRREDFLGLRLRYSNIRPIVRYRGRARVDHEIKWIGVDVASLLQIRDAGVVVLEEHFDGGLVGGMDGFRFRSAEYCVIRKDSPEFAWSSDYSRQSVLTEGVVLPTDHEIRFRDLFVSTEDGGGLRKALQACETADKWGHRESAPHVYRLYCLSQGPYDEVEIARRLIEDDKSDVFTKAVAATAARILKVEVRGHVERGLNVSVVSDNAFKRDYSDPSLSKRMSLLLFATDCWLHDQGLGKESKELESKRMAVELAREEQPGSPELRRLEMELAIAVLKARRQGSTETYMPSGLRKYLEELGFSGNQALHLRRIIEGGRVGGVHARTKKGAASTSKARSTASVQS